MSAPEPNASIGTPNSISLPSNFPAAKRSIPAENATIPLPTTPPKSGPNLNLPNPPFFAETAGIFFQFPPTKPPTHAQNVGRHSTQDATPTLISTSKPTNSKTFSTRPASSRLPSAKAHSHPNLSALQPPHVVVPQTATSATAAK